MRIGLVIYGSLDTVSGGYLYDRKLVAYLRSCGDEVDVVSVRPARYFLHLFDNISFRLPTDLDILIEDELVHASVIRANRQLSAINSRGSFPIVSLIHNLHSSERRAAWLNSIYRMFERAHLESVDGYICNSPVTEESVRRLVGDGKPRLIAPPGGDRLGTLSAQDVRRRASAPGPLRLTFLANITPLKGLHVVLDALTRLPSGSCMLDVVGSLQVDAPYALHMQAVASSLPISVSFQGVLDGQSLMHILKCTDVLVIPSYYEGFGIAYLEGMAFGVPAIGTTAGAIPHLIEHGKNGYLIEPGDSAELAALIERLAADRDLLGRLSMNALRHFASSPTWDQSAQRVREFLLQLLRR